MSPLSVFWLLVMLLLWMLTTPTGRIVVLVLAVLAIIVMSAVMARGVI